MSIHSVMGNSLLCARANTYKQPLLVFPSFIPIALFVPTFFILVAVFFILVAVFFILVAVFPLLSHLLIHTCVLYF